MFKVAFATSDRNSVDQHFGASAGFAIYAVNREHAQLIEVVEYPAESGDAPIIDGNEVAGQAYACSAGISRQPNALADKIAALADCAAVYCLAVGGSAVRQLLASGIQPVRLESACAIESLLLELRQAIRVGGIAWIDKRIKRDAAGSRFDRMAEEGWQE
jgi:nitrogen fixation protein NifX